MGFLWYFSSQFLLTERYEIVPVQNTNKNIWPISSYGILGLWLLFLKMCKTGTGTGVSSKLSVLAWVRIGLKNAGSGLRSIPDPQPCFPARLYPCYRIRYLFDIGDREWPRRADRRAGEGDGDRLW
jgi:hypothetical protein